MEPITVTLLVSNVESSHTFWSQYNELLISLGVRVVIIRKNEQMVTKETLLCLQSEDDYFNLLGKIAVLWNSSAPASMNFRICAICKPMNFLFLYAPSPEDPDSIYKVAGHVLTESNEEDSMDAVFEWLDLKRDDIVQKLQDLSDPSLKIEIKE